MKTILQFLFCLILTNLLNAQETKNFWKPQAGGLLPPNHAVYGISIVNKNVVWAVADSLFTDDAVPLTHHIKVLKSTNGGSTWRLYKVAEAVGRISFDIQAIDSSVAWITGQDYNNGLGRELFKTTDGGTTWVSKYKGVEAGVWLRFFDTQNAIILNAWTFALTSDGGNVWTKGRIAGFKENEGNLLFSGTNSCYVVGDTIWSGTSQARIVRSTDKGLTWTFLDLHSVANFDANCYILSIVFKDARNGIALAWSDGLNKTLLARTSDGGTTWSHLSTYPFENGTNIEYVKGTFGSFVVTDVNGLTVFTNNFGQTWHFADKLESNAIRIWDKRTGWVGYPGFTLDETPGNPVPALYKMVENTVINGTESLDADAISFKISPNPTSRFLTVEYADDFKPTSINIYDMSGKVVWRQKESFKPTQIIDLQYFISGTYFVQVQNTEGVATKKVVVQR